MNTSNLNDIVHKITNSPVTLPALNLDFSYEEFDEDLCFYYKHPSETFVKPPFEVQFSNIESLHERKTSDNKAYLSGIAHAQKPLLINIFESPLDSILEIDDVLIDDAINKRMSSLLIFKEGPGYFVQWLYNQYKEGFIIKEKPIYLDRAKDCSSKSKLLFKNNELSFRKSKRIKIKQHLLFNSNNLVYSCYNCELLTETRTCENCGNNKVAVFRSEIKLTDILRKIPIGITRNILNSKQAFSEELRI